MSTFETMFFNKGDSPSAERFRVLRWTSPHNTGSPPLLLLHGFTQSARSFAEVAHALTHTHNFSQVYAMDQRGHGESSWTPRDYSRGAMVSDLRFVVDELFGESEYILGGMSMGGGVCAAFVGDAAQESRHPSALVLVDWAPFPTDAPPPGVASIFNVFRAKFDSFEDAVDSMCSFNPRRSRENIASRLSHQLRENAEGKFVWNTDPAIADATLNKARESPDVMWRAVERISIPTLLLRGSKSDVLDETRAFELVHNRLKVPARLVTVEDAGHSVMGDKPVESAHHLVTWLSDLKNSSSL